MKFLNDYRIYNNFIFLIPVATGLYIQVVLFTTLATLVFFTSFYYHVILVKNSENKKLARGIDMVTAFACYLYLSYYILYHKQQELHAPLFVGLVSTLGVFALGKYKKSEIIHSLFHASIAVMASVIGIL